MTIQILPIFSGVEKAIEDLRGGRRVVVVDDEDRENEGDLVALADRITPETVNFFLTHGRGLLCIPMTTEHADELARGRVHLSAAHARDQQASLEAADDLGRVVLAGRDVEVRHARIGPRGE